MSEYQPDYEGVWQDFREMVRTRSTVRSLGLTAIESARNLPTSSSQPISVAKERLLRPYANEYLWQACLQSLDLKDIEGHHGESCSRQIPHPSYERLRISLSWSVERPLMSLDWEEDLGTVLRGRQTVLNEARTHSVMINSRFKAKEYVKNFIYSYDPDNPDMRTIFTMQPKEYSRKATERFLSIDTALLLANSLHESKAQ